MADNLVPAGASGPGLNQGFQGQGGPIPGSNPDLASLLIPGAVVSGRVIQSLGSEHYLLNLRGATLVVTSQVPLTSDSVVRFQVLNGGTQINLRMVDTADLDQAQTSTSAARLQALGLQPTTANTLALAAFEKAGAPLARDPILATATALAAVPLSAAPGSAATGSAAQAALADALAALAREGLPATPATIALSIRALAAALPNPAGALSTVAKALSAVPPATTGQPQAVTAPGGTDAAGESGSVGGPVGTAQPTASVPASPGMALPPSALPTTAPGPVSTVPGTTTVPSGLTTGTALITTPGSGTAAMPLPTAGGPPSAAMISPDAGNRTSAGGSSPIIVVVTPAAPAPATMPPMPATGATPAAAVPGPDAHPDASPTGPFASPGVVTLGSVVTGSPASTPAASVLAPAESPAPPILSPSSSLMLPGDRALRTLLAQGIPDATQGGAPAVMQALAWSGLRSSAAPTTAGSLLKHLAAALPTADGPDAPTSTAEASTARAALTQALAHAVRETSAMTVIKPVSLADYDVVLGVALADQGNSTPSRLAVAARPAPGGTTTFLRVDTELSHLGPISVRISGLNEGPMAITLLGDGGGARALAEALPGLADSLQQMGLVAGLRVASLAAEDGHGG